MRAARRSETTHAPLSGYGSKTTLEIVRSLALQYLNVKVTITDQRGIDLVNGSPGADLWQDTYLGPCTF